jgi:hypothetical protein
LQLIAEYCLGGTPEQMDWELRIQAVKQDLAIPEM